MKSSKKAELETNKTIIIRFNKNEDRDPSIKEISDQTFLFLTLFTKRKILF